MKVKFLEISTPMTYGSEVIIESTTSNVYVDRSNEWKPVIAKVDMKYSREIGMQLAKQLEICEENKPALDYKFVCIADNYILEGCFIQNADYSDDAPIEITIRYDNATKVND